MHHPDSSVPATPPRLQAEMALPVSAALKLAADKVVGAQLSSAETDTKMAMKQRQILTVVPPNAGDRISQGETPPLDGCGAVPATGIVSGAAAAPSRRSDLASAFELFESLIR